jgi:alpha-beta hydrolase superfamily lysophospholipase
MTDAVTADDVEAAEAEVPKGYTRTPRPVLVLLRAVDRRFGASAGVLYLGVLRQVRRYLADPTIKAAVDGRVEQAVGPACRVLIGHSLGSVVAYEYLRSHPGHGVDLLLTLGSPLGLRIVRDRLAVGPLPVPGWVNVRDVRDPVACAGPLHRWWPQIGRQGDVVVDNGGDAHAVERYLDRKATGAVLLRALPHLAGHR